MPESKTVVVGAIHITDTWTEMGGEPGPQDQSPGGWMDKNSLMDRVAYKIVRLLNAEGHQAIAVASSNIWRYRQYESDLKRLAQKGQKDKRSLPGRGLYPARSGMAGMDGRV